MPTSLTWLQLSCGVTLILILSTIKGEIMNKVMLLGILLSLFSCNSVDLRGTLKTHKKITLNSKSFWNGNKKVTLSPATFRGSRVSLSGSKLTLTVQHSGKTTKIEMPAKKLNIPTGSGRFKVSKGKIGQNYDMSGNIKYNERQSSYREVEYRSCSVTEEVYKCNGKLCGQQRCCMIRVDRPGTEMREYYNVSFSRDVVINLLSSGSTVATFNGSGSGNFRRYVNNSYPYCRLN